MTDHEYPDSEIPNGDEPLGLAKYMWQIDDVTIHSDQEKEQ